MPADRQAAPPVVTIPYRLAPLSQTCPRGPVCLPVCFPPAPFLALPAYLDTVTEHGPLSCGAAELTSRTHLRTISEERPARGRSAGSRGSLWLPAGSIPASGIRLWGRIGSRCIDRFGTRLVRGGLQLVRCGDRFVGIRLGRRAGIRCWRGLVV